MTTCSNYISLINFIATLRHPQTCFRMPPKGPFGSYSMRMVQSFRKTRLTTKLGVSDVFRTINSSWGKAMQWQWASEIWLQQGLRKILIHKVSKHSCDFKWILSLTYLVFSTWDLDRHVGKTKSLQKHAESCVMLRPRSLGQIRGVEVLAEVDKASNKENISTSKWWIIFYTAHFVCEPTAD